MAQPRCTRHDWDASKVMGVIAGFTSCRICGEKATKDDERASKSARLYALGQDRPVLLGMVTSLRVELAIPSNVVRCGCLGCLTDDCAHWGKDCSLKDYTPCLIGRTLDEESPVLSDDDLSLLSAMNGFAGERPAEAEAARRNWAAELDHDLTKVGLR